MVLRAMENDDMTFPRIENSKEYIASRIDYLIRTDHEFRAAFPLEEVNRAKSDSSLGLAEVVEICMEAYSERPALAGRAKRVIDNNGIGELEILDSFESVSYGEIWTRARSLANFWFYDETAHLRADEFICINAFAGPEFATIDLAAIRNGAVVVPIQTNAPYEQLLEIVDEVQPRWIATSAEHLLTTVKLVIDSRHPPAILLFDYLPGIESQRLAFDQAIALLEDGGMSDLILTVDELCETGKRMAQAPLYSRPDSGSRLSTIYYTSGSTGLPKGAMFPEQRVRKNWQRIDSLPMLYLSYMPMNHAFGRNSMFATLGQGGTCYFTGRSDLSLLFDDIRLVRPTSMGFVPRVCEMIYQRFEVEFERRSAGTTDIQKLKMELLSDIRNDVLGGRLLDAKVGSAPLAPLLREFMEACLGFRLNDFYGATEIQGVLRNNRVMKPPVIDYKLEDVRELGYFSTDKPYPRGELLVKTENIMLGYYKRPEVTASVFDDEGFYKTGDIMAEIEPDHLVYVDRRNNVQKLSQGEFVAIALREATYTNGHPLIKQAYLYGSSDRSFLVGVFVPNPEVVESMGIAGDDQAIKAALREAINEVAHNEKLLAHEVPRDFIVEYEPFSTENGLLAGIGKYQRPKFKEKYGERLEALYDAIEGSRERELQALRREGRDLPVLETVGRAVKAVLGLDELDTARRVSFIELGGDSLTALSCSMLLEEIYGIEVPASVINNPAGSLQQLAQYIDRARDTSFRHPTFTSVHGKGATEIHASDLVLEKFIDDDTLRAAQSLSGPTDEIRTVLVTGANGFLGRFLCLEWLERMAKVDGGKGKVICIIRGEDNAAAWTRLASVFDSGDAELKAHFETLARDHLEVLAGDLGEPHMGLSPTDWQRLAETVDHIVHPAAFVNHVLPYAQLFGPNVVGTAELIRLALTHHQKPIDNVSTMAVASLPGGGVMGEEDDVRTATPVRHLDEEKYAAGYADSKWAAEVLLRDASDRFGLPVSIFRSDMILAHSRYKGQINVPDMFTRWLLSTLLTGLAPASYYEAAPGVKPHYDGLPVDFTAAAIATLGEHTRAGYHNYHVVNPHDDGISMDTFIDWAIEAGYRINRVEDYGDWLSRFETALRALPDEQRQQSSLPLLHQFQRPLRPVPGAKCSAENFKADVDKYNVMDLGKVPHVTSQFLRKSLKDISRL